VSARWLVYETREDECAEPDWYEVTCEYWLFTKPHIPTVWMRDDHLRYKGPINREILRKLDAALGKPWGMS